VSPRAGEHRQAAALTDCGSQPVARSPVDKAAHPARLREPQFQVGQAQVADGHAGPLLQRRLAGGVHKRGLVGVQVTFKAQLGLAACHDGQVMLGMLALPAHLDEPERARVAAAPHLPAGALIALEGDHVGEPGNAQRHHHDRVRGGLLPPGGRRVPGACRDDDPVIRGPRRVAECPVPADDRHIRVAGFGQAMACLLSRFGEDVDRGDVAVRAGQAGEQGRVDAGPGADLQDAVTGLHVELLQHLRDAAGQGGAAEHGAVHVSVSEHDAVCVRVSQRPPGEEQVPRYGTHRLLDPLRERPPAPYRT